MGGNLDLVIRADRRVDYLLMFELPTRLLDRIVPEPNSGCWLYAGTWHSNNGYGKVSWNGKDCMFHRVVYELLVGPIPPGAVLDHKCRVRWCCNPDHLEPVSVQVNTVRGEAVLFGQVCHAECA